MFGKFSKMFAAAFSTAVLSCSVTAQSRYSQRGRMEDMQRNQAFLMTDVWVRRNGEWQAVSRHISPLDSPR